MYPYFQDPLELSSNKGEVIKDMKTSPITTSDQLVARRWENSAEQINDG
jgi:hypothetical protein